MQGSLTQIGDFSFYPGQQVGEGATGLVYKGFRNYDHVPVAVKAIKLQDVNTPVKKHLLDCEVAALKSVRNRYVCQAYDVLKDGQFYYVPMEYCPNGTLREYVLNRGKLPENEALSLFAKIMQGYCAIRQAGFIHRDLKTENILLRPSMEPAIIDFGYCQKVQTQGKNLTYNVGSPAYMSPEAYNDNFYSEKSDIWALGVVLHEMVTGHIPVMRTADVDEYFRYLKSMSTAEIVRNGQSEATSSIILKALSVDARLRPNGIELQRMVNSVVSTQSPTKSNRSNNNYQRINQPQRAPTLQRANSNREINYAGGNKIAERTIQQPLSQSGNLFSFVPQKQIILNQQSQQQRLPQYYSDNSSTNSVKGFSNQSPNSPTLRKTLPSGQQQPQPPNFLNLRKRIQTANFNINLTPVRNTNNYVGSQNVEQSAYLPKYEPMTPTLEYKRYQNDPAQDIRMRKSNSFSSINIQLAHRF